MASFLRELTTWLRRLAPDAHFVGGCVRDCLLGIAPESLRDFDLVLPGDPWPAARRLARALGGSAFRLHEEERIVRIVLAATDDRSLRRQVDLAATRGTLADDLRARDFTINAMAIPVAADLCSERAIVDPLGGRRDLAERRLRFCSPEAPLADPLRTLRGIRFCHQLRFALEPETARQLRAAAPRLGTVARERIRDEFFLLLETSTAPDGLRDLERYDLWPHVVAEPPAVEPSARALSAWLATSQRWRSDPTLGPPIVRYLEESISEPRGRELLLRWAACLWPTLGSPADLAAADRRGRHLRLSGREITFVRHALAAATEALELAQRWPVSPRERLRFFRRARDAGPGAILLAASVADAPAWPPLLQEAFHRLEQSLAPLVTGRDVMRLLGLKPGPWIGRLLDAVEEERADGRLTTREEALDWLRRVGPALARAAGAPPDPPPGDSA